MTRHRIRRSGPRGCGISPSCPSHARSAVAGLSPSQLDTPYRDGGWTVRQVVHHLADSHMNAFIRFKLALTEERPADQAVRREGMGHACRRAGHRHRALPSSPGGPARAVERAALIAFPRTAGSDVPPPGERPSEDRPDPADLRVALPPPRGAHPGAARREAAGGRASPVNRAMETPRSQGSAILAVAACALLWSTGGLFVKLIAWNPFAIAGIRSLIGGLVILVFLRKPRFTWSFAQIAGAVCYAACMIGFVSANKLTTAANAILLQYTAPLYAAVLGWIFLKEKASSLDWVTMAVVHRGHGPVLHGYPDPRRDAGKPPGHSSAVYSLPGRWFPSGRRKTAHRLNRSSSATASRSLVAIPFLWQGWPSIAGVGSAGLPGRFPDRDLVHPPDLRREARDAPCSPC